MTPMGEEREPGLPVRGERVDDGRQPAEQDFTAPEDTRDRSFEFARRIVLLCRTLEAKPGVGRTLSKQLLRSGTSIGANIEEAKSAHSRADLIAKYTIACKEARETHYWLRLLAATDTMSERRLKDLTDETGELIAVLTTIIKRLRQPQISRSRDP